MKKMNLTGQRYGNLAVLRPAENISGRAAWVCRCDCGQERILRIFASAHIGNASE